jgi:hypothetical protein
MTAIRDHRTHPRTPCLAHLEIDCMSCRTREHIQGVTYNMSDEGLYVEAARHIERGARIIIQDVRDEQAEQGCGELRGNAGVVRWIRHMERDGDMFFGYGIWLYYPDLAEGFDSMRDIRFFCDMCGKPVKIRELKQQKGPLWMCPRCNRHIEGLPDELEQDLDRYLVGNVL